MKRLLRGWPSILAALIVALAPLQSFAADVNLVGDSTPATITGDHDYSGGTLGLPTNAGKPSATQDEGDVVFDTTGDGLYVSQGGGDWSRIGPTGRNLLINGGMRVAQMGTSFASVADDAYTLDQWVALHNGTATVAQETSFVPTGTYASVKLTVGATNAQVGIVQILEARDAAAIIGGTASLSFKVYTPAGPEVAAVRAAILSWSSTADSVTSDVVATWGATPTWATNWTVENTPADCATTAATWVTCTVTAAAIDTASAKNVAVVIWIADTTTTVNDDVYIASVQIEEGPVATPFEWRVYAEELAKSQRYLFCLDDAAGAGRTLGIGHAYHTTYATYVLQFPVDMRTSPSASHSSLSNFYMSVATTSAALNAFTFATDPHGARMVAGRTGGGLTINDAVPLGMYGGAGAYLCFDARL